MSNGRDRALVVWLRVIGTVDLLAFVAMFQSAETLARMHQSLGMGEFPTAAIAAYLARTASMLYGLCGVLLLYLSTDIHRYRPAIRFIAACGLAAGPLLIAIDRTSGMPVWWMWTEGPLCSAIWFSVWWLAASE